MLPKQSLIQELKKKRMEQKVLPENVKIDGIKDSIEGRNE
jgi:hypothetical protein